MYGKVVLLLYAITILHDIEIICKILSVSSPTNSIGILAQICHKTVVTSGALLRIVPGQTNNSYTKCLKKSPVKLGQLFGTSNGIDDGLHGSAHPSGLRRVLNAG